MTIKFSAVLKVSAFYCLVILASCSALKKEDPEKEIRMFISSFEKSLAGDDDIILQNFETRQSKESLLAAIKVLQNTNSEHIRCYAQFNQASISMDEYGIRVIVPVNLNTEDIDQELVRQTSFTLWLKRKENSFAISKLDGEQFYTSYISLKSEISWSVERIKEYTSREPIYTRALELQQRYDSVIWYTYYKNDLYYYVINGKWSNYFIRFGEEPLSKNYKMGLIDNSGKIIIPAEFDLVGTLGLNMEDIIEVKKDGKVGYYSLQGNVIIEPEYDYIIPYEKDGIYALVRNGNTTGWISATTYFYTAGLPPVPGVEEYMMEYKFLASDFTFSEKDQSLCEIPHKDYIGYGIVMPPSYWTHHAIFKEIVGGISVSDTPYNAYTDYIETGSTLFQRITNNVHAIMTTITERYLDGREEFYTHNKLVFVNDHQDTLATKNISTSGNIDFVIISEDLLEVKYIEDTYYEGEVINEYNVPRYCYFRLAKDFSIKSLPTNRRFAHTQYVKLDSTYLSGDFNFYNMTLQREDHSDFLSNETLHFMRNEILAFYGYRFTDERITELFNYNGWYEPRYDSYLEVLEQMTEIDRFNLEFLDKLLGPFQDGKSV